MFPDTPGVYSQYNFGQLFAQIAALGTGIANSVSGNPPSGYAPTLYPWAAYNGLGPNPYSQYYIPTAGPYGNLSGYPATKGLFDTYNSGPFAGSSGILAIGVILLVVILIARKA